MKKTIATLLIVGATCSSSFAKPGGWIKDFFLNNNNNHCHQQGNYYYQQRPVYYYEQPRVIVYERPVRYYQPRNIPMQPYQNHYRNRSQGYYNCW